MALTWNTVAIPFAQGIQPSSQARLLDMQKLLRAQNCVYRLDNGPEKRPGHTSRAVTTGKTPFIANNGEGSEIGRYFAPPPRPTYSLINPQLPSSWFYGYGIHSQNEDGNGNVSEDPRAGLLFGQAERDTEVLTWDGHRLYSYAPNQDHNFGQVYEQTTVSAAPSARGFATMPAMHAEPYAKTPVGQLYPDAADNGVVRTAAWVESLATPTTLSWITTDSASGAILSLKSEVLQTPNFVRVVTVGAWTHILVSDTTANELLLRSFHQDTPNTVISRSLGAFGTNKVFDVKKYSESFFAVARISTTNTVVSVSLLNADGSTYTSFQPDLGGNTVIVLALAISSEFNLGLVWSDAAGSVYFSQYTSAGVLVGSLVTVNNAISSPSMRLTISQLEITNPGSSTNYVWRIFVEDKLDDTRTMVLSYTVDNNGGHTLRQTRHQLGLASHAFTVGNKVFVWCRTHCVLQPGWYLCDQELLPVGRLDYGLADVGPPGGKMMPSVNWCVQSPDHPYKDHLVWVGCLGYKQRVNTSTSVQGQPSGVFAEPSIRFYKLDFLPQLRSAQAGRSTYFAGAQLWQYDGLEINEAGFHQAPELWANPAPAPGGSMSSSGKYQYRIDLCHKNAQNEEVRSWSLITTVDMGASDTQVTITIPHVAMTRREDAYFLVFRTEKNLTSFYLVSSRNPADASAAANGFVKNSRASTQYTFVDRLSDANARTREYHPANAAGFVQPLPAPACELVVAGRDRLWLAGGELSPGELAPSRLFFPGQCPSFNPGLNIQVDRGIKPITGIGFAGQIMAVFLPDMIHTIQGDGPDNLGQGEFGTPQDALTDVGCISPESIVVGGPGIFFQSAVGIRLLSPSGQLITGASGTTLGVGTEVDPLTAVGDYAAAVAFPDNSELRWYSRDDSKPTMVYNYQNGTWVTWTGVTCVGASYWGPGRTVILSKPDGYLWRETTGLFVDEDRTYETVVQTAWLRAQNLGDFHRFGRLTLYGQAAPSLALRIRYFYNEQPFHTEEQIVNFSQLPVYNDSVWGDGFWNSGSWGDADNTAGQPSLFFRDGVFRVRKMPARQKCSVFSIEFSDQGNTDGGFTPTVLGLRLGTKQGLDHIPT